MNNEFKKIATALSICMPETLSESEMQCEECPFYSNCKSENAIALPESLVIAIRNYFSFNRYGETPVQ